MQPQPTHHMFICIKICQYKFKSNDIMTNTRSVQKVLIVNNQDWNCIDQDWNEQWTRH